MANEKLYSNHTNAHAGHFGSAPDSAYVQKTGDTYLEKTSRVTIVKKGEREAKKEFLVIGYLLNSNGSARETVILRDSLDEVSEIPYAQFYLEYSLVKVLREGITPDLIYLDGIPDKIVSGQHWVPKDNASTDPFSYSSKGTYASDESPSSVWEVQSVIDGEVTLLLIEKEDDRQFGHTKHSRTTEVKKLTKRELVTKYRLHSHGFFLSNDFFKFIQNETYVAPENRDKIYMMGRGGKGEYVKMDDMVGPPQNNNHVKLDNL
jgi:hypothetical protein